MSAHSNEYLDLCAGYALGSLDARDEDRLLDHLEAGCPECEAALADFRRAVPAIGLAESPVDPPARVKDRVMAAIGDEGTGPIVHELPRSRGVAPWVTWGLAAAAVALLVSNVVIWRGMQHVQGERNALVAQLSDLQEQLQDATRWAHVATNPNARFAALDPTPDGDAALDGWATLDPQTGDAIVVLKNAAAPTQRDYELWAIQDGTPTSLGLVRADAQGVAVLQLSGIDDVAAIQALAVSLEPQGGSPQATPTGPVVMVGNVGG